MIKRNCLPVLYIIFLTVFFSRVSAQDTSNTIGNVSIASPTAASLGKYGDIPISYNTGIPNISVPIYTVQSGSLKLPISLSYHASGLKVQEPSSWVGAGWSLNAGGVITRTVVGAPDDRGFSVSNVTNGHFSDYGYNSYLNNGLNNTGVPDDQAFARGTKDGEPDLYFFNFGSYTGKFYFNDDRTPILYPEEDFNIQPFYLLGQGFLGFIVTNPDGTRYYFGQTGNDGTVSPVESTIPSTVQNGAGNANAAASSWFLNKIVSADGMDSINLRYQSESYSYYTLALSPVSSVNYTPTNSTLIGINLVKNFVTGVRLSQVSFPNGTVTFTKALNVRADLSNGTPTGTSMYDGANNSSYALGSISIANNSGFCKKDSFYYGYFYDNTALNTNFFGAYSIDNLTSDEYRLRLDSVQESSCDASIKVPSYKFSYFSEAVPRRLSFGIDHWGFINGVTTNSVLVPTYNVTTSGTTVNYPGAMRDPVWPAMRAGSLQQITYPTGGYTNLNFEANDTYTSYTSTQTVTDLNSEIGYDGGTTPQSTPLTANINQYEVNQSNNTSYAASMAIENSSGTVIQTISIPANSSSQSTLSLAAGNYTFVLSWVTTPTLPGGSGAIFTLTQAVPVTVTANTMVGGLRIKTITNNDGLTPNNMVTSYVYTTSGVVGAQTSGVLYSRPVYVQILRNDLYGQIDGPYCSANGCLSCDGYNAHLYYISPAAIMPMATCQGNIVGYNQVYVSQNGNGYTNYQYYGSNLWDSNTGDVCVRNLTQSSSCDPTIPNFPAAPLPFDFMRGELKYEGHFNQSGHVLKESYYYPTYVSDSLVTICHKAEDMASTIASYTEYNLQSAYKVQDKLVQIDYDPANSNSLSTTSTTYYGSPFHHQPTRKVTTTSTGDSLATNIKYAMDYRIPSCDAAPDSLLVYLNTVAAAYTSFISNIYSCTPQQVGVNNCRLAVEITYRENVSAARIAFLNYRLRRFSDSVNLQHACYLAALPSADTVLKPILRLQNMYENAAIETSSWKDLNLLHANFTKYDTSLSPVGYAYPGRTKLINLQSPSSSFTNSAVSGNTVSIDSRYVDESVYKFLAGNPAHVIPHDGVASAYIWDYLNTEPIAKASNATIDQVAYTSFEADGNGSWVFTGTPVTDATSPTGSKCYGLASGNISRSGLTSTSTYIVSYWSKTGTSYSVTGSTAVKQGKTINGWTYFEHTVTGTTSVTVSGSGSIDELRLYPSAAQMNTYTYTPLLGMTCAADADNKITYYFYDNLGRLKWIKDQDGNIIKTIQYHYQTITGTFY